jgi:hypothetical protein
MADFIGATPRNKFLGLLADGIGGATEFATRNNPPVNMMAGLLGLPAITNTLNEMSYGGALGAGSGMTWKPKADTVDAAMTVLPLGATLGKAAIDGGVKLAQKATPAIEAAVNRTMAKGGLPAQLLQDMAQGSRSQIFIGKNAKTWDAASAKKAEEMLASGADPRKIWSETGTWKGPDGHLRQEIPDNNSALRLTGPKLGTESMSKAGEVLGHKQLFKAYPDAANINITWNDAKGTGSYSSPRTYAQYIDIPRASGVGAADTPKGSNSVALHEMQHAIQQREGFARGGSPEMFPDYKGALERAKSNGGFDPLTGDADFVIEDAMKNYGENPFDAYQRLAGEAEARATQARLGMDMAQRRATFPLDSYDVPVNQLIVRGLLGK